jgi:uncharacterized membrane protein YfcA
MIANAGNMTAARALWLGCAALLAGAVNSVAGGGSFLSFPALLSMGVLPIQANATNTVALWPGQFTSIAAYRSEWKGNRPLILPLMLAAAMGGICGAFILLNTRQNVFLHLIPWLLLVAASIFALSGPLSTWLQRRAQSAQAHPVPARSVHALRLPLFGATLLVSLYIGYFGAGGGFLLLAALALAQVGDITQMNALKVVVTTIANGVAVLVFILHGKVIWHDCLLMMVTGAAGGYLGARNARRVNPKVMRGIVTVIGFAMAGYFFWKNGGL